MAEREIKVKLQNARDVKSNWERNNPVLLDGEIGVVYDATDDPNQPRLKIGDGHTDYNTLPYFEDPTKVDKAQMGLPNGVASLDKNGIIPLSQLPDIIGGTGDSTTHIEKIPEQLGKLVYNGQSQMPVWRYYDMEAFIIGGTISAVDAGTYTTTFQPAEGYAWSDGSRAPVYCQWMIQRQVIETEPIIEDFELTFSGELQSPIIVDCDLDAFVMSGQTEATIVGDYSITLTPDKNHCWSDGSWDALTLSWSIVPCIRALPELEGEYTYNGASQTPTWKNYPAAGVNATGETSAINAGTYTVTFQLEDGYVWDNENGGGGNLTHITEWIIAPAVGELSIDPTSLSFEGIGNENAQMIVAETNVPSEIEAVSEDTKVATVTSSGKIITVTPVKFGNTNIAVSTPVHHNYSLNSILCPVSIEKPLSFADTPWKSIQSQVRAGKAPSLYVVGDTKPTTLNGTALDATFNNYEARDTILAFNHNAEVEGNNTLMIGLAWMDKAGAGRIALCNSAYRSWNSYVDAGKTGFCMNRPDSQTGAIVTDGGWRDCYMRSDGMPSIEACMSEDERAVIAEHVIYTSNGLKEAHGVAESVTATHDRLYLPSEYEVFGIITYSNPFEEEYQRQLAYFANGASIAANGTAGSSIGATWWERSPANSSTIEFCYIYESRTTGCNIANYNRAVRPVFCIA